MGRERNRTEIGFSFLAANNYHLIVAAPVIERLKHANGGRMDGWMAGWIGR